MQRDPRIDEKIAQAGDFAKPVLEHFRALIHSTIDGIEKTVKWGMPHFTYNGKNIAGMAAFKAHCAVVIHGAGRQGEQATDTRGMGSYGKVGSLADLPDDAELAAKLREARERIETDGSAVTRQPAARTTKKAVIPVPDDFAAALARDEVAQAMFDGFAPSQRWEYLDWITGAKRDGTRNRRIGEAVGWIAEGKKRNWKYES
ncbi:MAG: YdeI/OmpD-associated family protein [Croceibacterium sp.]